MLERTESYIIKDDDPRLLDGTAGMAALDEEKVKSDDGGESIAPT